MRTSNAHGSICIIEIDDNTPREESGSDLDEQLVEVDSVCCN